MENKKYYYMTDEAWIGVGLLTLEITIAVLFVGYKLLSGNWLFFN